ncbi:guanylate kinase [Mesomycoplasma hyopneumoniae]|uniref:Guanylate kinase n=2 Tax=Mesomycoplasma hyopneumoniae TaxID=2099 RepID=KGUA_MESH7|nr:RecName: Full=Guanylate kinase; AltName: Full=GMP kinase [Mesomycoplasma hyopneumoniae 7448]AGQ50785.1 guanylate kinase [Mesomycoplasma hyopneumoniae 7422]MXR10376.1 guanylate kinase [Mesomycoplasma hyopneumoniae]AAZ53527.1 guanylate kinase [Mesomycoplasma hyopneumoniae 7448]MXR10896.1 guanylate kinase [Mesomycoplasma hyopneumoniae]MXR33513.1 guanylate kinase [Mesomycoplasma hyopneumoniae]
MKVKMSKLIILSGPSGVGKGTIESLLLKNKNLLIKLAISATTREKRRDEINGVNYFFLTVQEFKEKIENDEFIEWSCHFNNYYGTLKSQIKFIQSQNFIPLLEIDTTGAKNIIENYKNKGELSQLLTIFILPPSIESLKNRIQKRLTETNIQINQRLEKAKAEIKVKNLFKFQVVNDNLEKCVAQIEKIISKEIQKT